MTFKKLQDTLQKNTGYQELVSKVLQGENVEKDLKMKPTEISTKEKISCRKFKKVLISFSLKSALY